MTLQEVKDQVAVKHGFECWDRIRPVYEGRYFDEVAELYVSETLKQRDKELLEANFDIAELKKLLTETATRTQLIFPTDHESLQWFNEGTNWVKSDFFIRLYEHFGIDKQCDKCGRALQGGLFCPDCDL